MIKRACNSCRTLLEAKWDAETLDAAQAEGLRHHLVECEECRALDHELGALLSVSREMGALRYSRAINLSPIVLSPPRSLRLRPAMAVAILSVVALAAGVFLGRAWNGPGKADQSQPGAILVRMAVPAPSAHTVELTGDFTNWEGRVPLTPTGGGLWSGELRVPPGRYRYVIIIDGQRMEPDPTARQVVDDGFGGRNSVLNVGGI